MLMPSNLACPCALQVFCGNFEYDASEKEIYRLFEKYGEVDRIDMKTGELGWFRPYEDYDLAS